jgi:hypothetical protein
MELPRPAQQLTRPGAPVKQSAQLLLRRRRGAGHGDPPEAQRAHHRGDHAGRVPLHLVQQRALPGRALDLLPGQDVDLLLAVRVAGEEVPDPVQQPLLPGEHAGLPHVEHGRLELGPGSRIARPVGAAAGAGNPPSGDRVRPRRQDRRLDDPHAHRGEHRAGRHSELGIPVTDATPNDSELRGTSRR